MGSKTNNQKIKYKGRMPVENLIIIRKGLDVEGYDSDITHLCYSTVNTGCIP